MNIADNSKVVFLKYQKSIFINQLKNQKFVLFIKIINITNKQLSLFIILKGKKQKNDQFIQKLKSNHCILLKKTGLTNNKLCIKQMKEYFKLFIKSYF